VLIFLKTILFSVSKGLTSNLNSLFDLSFKKHSHPYAVIIKNIYGDSTWIINKKKYKLNNQNVFVIDKNIDHEVVSIETPKLSMTINLE